MSQKTYKKNKYFKELTQYYSGDSHLLIRKIPPRGEILAVYGVITFMFSTWTILVFMWKLPSWILYLTGGQIAGIFFYSMAANLFEGLIVLILALLFAAILPARQFRDIFVVRGTWLSISVIGFMMIVLWLASEFGRIIVEHLIYYLLGSGILTAVIVFLGGRIRQMKSTAEFISDRLLVFLFVLIPIYLISFIIVVVRNLT